MNKSLSFKLLFAGAMLLVGTSAMAQTVESLMGTGQELLQRGAYSQAVNAFKQVLAREPDYFEAQFNLGFTYLQWGNYNQAVIELKKALRRQSRNSEAWSNLAIAYDNLNRSNDAMDALAQAVNCDPGNMTARMNLAVMYANANRMQQATAQYRQIVKMDTANGEALINLSKCLIATGGVKEAKEFLCKAIAAEPGKGEPHLELGTIYLKKDHDTAKAIEEYRKAISLEPGNPAFYQELGMVLEQKGQKKEAIEVWKTMLGYLDDAINKDKIRDRIDRLEKGTVTAAGFGGGSAGSAFSEEKTRKLEQELRPETSQKETKRIKTKPVNVSNDFEEVNADTAGAWDLEKEAKKRAKDRKSAEGR